MSRSSPSSSKPLIPGYEVDRYLGGGGFADVWLCSDRLGRQVAVKVLRTTQLQPKDREKFDIEAKTMGLLSHHPAIVTIFDASVGADGRPYLAMEYCPTSLRREYATRQFRAPEVLDLGVQIAGAVQAAHSMGVLHRDIKPDNILVTPYGQAQLTDFGISARLDESGQVEGFSPPWAPPEAFDAAVRPDVRSDVWSLAATLYTLLAGRAPFQVAGRTVSNDEMADRIERVPLPPISREGVPEALERVLRAAMTKRPDERTPSAEELGRSLQRIQTELKLPTTHWYAEVVERPATFDTVDGEQGTRQRSITAISPKAPTQPRLPTRQRGDVRPSQPTVAAPAASAPYSAGPIRGPGSMESGDGSATEADTMLAEAAPVSAVGIPARRSHRGVVIGLISLVVLGGVVAGLWFALDGQRSHRAAPESGESSGPIAVVAETVLPPKDLVGRPNGDKVTFTWTNPKPVSGDTYLWRTIDATGPTSELETTTETKVTVPATKGETCLEVYTRRANAKSSATSTKACAVATGATR